MSEDPYRDCRKAFEVTSSVGWLFLALISGLLLIVGLKTGKMPDTGPEPDRRESPGIFWFTVAVFLMITVGSLYKFISFL